MFIEYSSIPLLLKESSFNVSEMIAKNFEIDKQYLFTPMSSCYFLNLPFKRSISSEFIFCNIDPRISHDCPRRLSIDY